MSLCSSLAARFPLESLSRISLSLAARGEKARSKERRKKRKKEPMYTSLSLAQKERVDACKTRERERGGSCSLNVRKRRDSLSLSLSLVADRAAVTQRSSNAPSFLDRVLGFVPLTTPEVCGSSSEPRASGQCSASSFASSATSPEPSPAPSPAPSSAPAARPELRRYSSAPTASARPELRRHPLSTHITKTSSALACSLESSQTAQLESHARPRSRNVGASCLSRRERPLSERERGPNQTREGVTTTIASTKTQRAPTGLGGCGRSAKRNV